ncbi:MAG: hypothetical protein ABI328_12530 [Gemmatimonadaceae bacterium]
MSDTTSRSGFGTDMATSVAESSFIKALSLADATMLAAGTMVGSCSLIISSNITARFKRLSGCSPRRLVRMRWPGC